MLTVLQVTVNILYHVDDDKLTASDIMLTCVFFAIGSILDLTGDVMTYKTGEFTWIVSYISVVCCELFRSWNWPAIKFAA